MMTTHDQWIRKATLVVSDDSDGLDLSELHFKFDVMQSDFESPDNSYIRVYNLSDSTAKKIQNEFTKVTLQAGYQNGAFGTIFSGTIKQTKRGRENATDKYLDIIATDSDINYNFGVVNKTLEAGAEPSDISSALASAMDASISYESYNVGASLPRGKVLYGMARTHMRALAKTTKTTWSLQDGKLVIIPKTGYLPNEAVVLNSKTGLVGLPEQTEDGIKAVCLLNPNIVIGSRVQIDNESIQKQTFSTSYTAINMYPSIAADGIYRVLVAEYHGDTRGHEWYTTITGLTINETNGEVIAD